MSRLLTNLASAGRSWSSHIRCSYFSTCGNILQNTKSSTTDDLFESLFKHIPKETTTNQSNSTLGPDPVLQEVLRSSATSSIGRQRPPIPKRDHRNDVVNIDWDVLGGIDKAKLARTGVMASRSVIVREGAGGLQNALRQLDIMNKNNNIRYTKALQRYHEKPGKKKARLRQKKQQFLFDAEIRRLMALVSEAKRKGY